METPRRRRRRRSQMQIFKEDYLPTIIVCLAFLLIVIFAIGSIARSIQRNNVKQVIEKEETVVQQQTQHDVDAEVSRLLAEAESYANDFDYEQAIAVLDSFSGDINDYAELTSMRQKYVKAQSELVLWPDNGTIPNLSFQMLIADTQRAFSPEESYASSYKSNFITTSEFTNILHQLYENDYILVDMDDIVKEETDSDGNVYYTTNDLYLPVGKKPVMITQTQVNYYMYMVDKDKDGFADQDGAGFANKLVVDENGNLACEIVNADGSVSTGAYDLIPILESFIATHPDFSYRGARATIAVSGCEGIFGYRISSYFSSDEYPATFRDQQIEDAKIVLQALKDSGYEIACYTYENVAYGTMDLAAMNADMNNWLSDIFPVLGSVDTFVFAKNSDISNVGTLYSGEKFNSLMNLGFKHYLGFSESGSPWLVVADNYMRQGRLMVSGDNLANNPQWFVEMFDAESVLDPDRSI